MKILLKLALIGLLGGAVLSAFASGNHQASGQKTSDDINYLFIDVAEHGALQKNKDNTYSLTLYQVDDWVTYFSDVPHRVTGIMTLEDFGKMVNQETSTKYPKGLNSGLVAVEADKQKVRYMLSLSNVQYDAKTGTATFTAHAIPGENRHPLPDSAKFKHVSLFVDGICISCMRPH